MQHRIRLTILFVLLVSTLKVWAVPAQRISITVKQPDGTELVLTKHGDEYFHCLITNDGVPVVRHENAYYYAHFTAEGVEPTEHLAHEKAKRTAEEVAFVASLPDIQQARNERMQRVIARRCVTRSSGVAEVPTRGKVSVPIILIQFADVKFASADPIAAFEERVNGDNFTAQGGHGSIREYFVDQSGGLFEPHFDIIGPITLDHVMSYYGGNDKEGNDLRPREMVSEACTKAFAELKADFTRYDNNGDGYVDIVYAIYAGYGEASYPDRLENTIWPHQWELENPLALGGVNVRRYACNNELDGYEGNVIDGIGTFCHEFSHCLGLPDFYDTSSSDVSAFGMNVWSIMDYGCYNNNGHTPCAYTAYEKDYLGWISLTELDEPTEVTLSPLNEGGKAYKIVNEENPDEFYVLEYYQKAGWNAHAPAEGMIIMHVDYLAEAWNANVLNNNPDHQRMTIIPADALLSRQTLATDLWTGKDGQTELTPVSSPAAKVYTGGYMNKDITNISMQDGKVTFSFMKWALEIPKLNDPENITQTGFALNWNKVKDVEEYEVRLDRLVENPYLIKEDFDKVEKDENDIGGILDNYTRQKGWNGKEIYGLDGAIRIGQNNKVGILMSPYIECNSSMVTIVFTIRKGIPEGVDASMIMAIGDREWGNRLYGHRLTIDDKMWGNYCLLIDSIGNNPFLYIDTRDNTSTPQKESLAIEIDRLYVLSGDRTDELLEDNLSEESPEKRTIRPVSTQTMTEWMVTSHGITERMTRSESTNSVDEESTKGVNYDEIPVYTTKTKDSRFTFSELDGGLYRCRVRSMKGEITSPYSNTVDVLLVDTLLPRTDTVPLMYIHHDSMYVIAPDSVVVYYTTDGTHPSAYSTRYTGPFALGSKMTVQAMARRTGWRSSEVVCDTNWFELDGATYRIVSDVEPAVMLSERVEGNDKDDYRGHRVFGNEVKTNSQTYQLKGIDSHAFRNAESLRSVTLQGDAIQYVGDSLFHGCSALNAVVWNVDLPMENNFFDEKSYYNLLIYLPDTASLDNSLIKSGNMFVVKGDTCSSVNLNAGKPFYCPQPFVAENVAYQRNFTQNTVIGGSAGWETLTLPFDVQRVEHTIKGTIVPFGVQGEHHYWLSSLEDEGFAPATAIRANVPYIIAMPNNSAYGEHVLDGVVTFSAKHTLIHTTNGDMAVEGDRFSFVPTYDKVIVADSIYALNLGNTYTVAETYAPGSVFVANKYVVHPFSAFVMPRGEATAPMYRIFHEEEGSVDEVKDFVVTVDDGVVYIYAPHDCVVTVRDMTGRQVRSVVCTTGVNEVTSLTEGMYIIETTKVYVGR